MVNGKWVAPPDPWKGVKVCVPQGTPILSDYRPGSPINPVAKRDQVVTVAWSSTRCDDHGNYQPTVHWAGSGGYWRSVWLNAVEVLPESEQEA